MLQEIHFKLMNRIREKKEKMENSDWQLCPRIKIKLDKQVTLARNWKATYDGSRKFAVKQGTKTVTVDLNAKSCDCRIWDLTGIPCQHAIAAIHDRRLQPLDFVEDWYKREKYLKAYAIPLDALKSEEFWEIKDTTEMLPPDVPKKMRGRPKKLRRREDWEGGNRSRSSQAASTDIGSKRRKLLTGKKMHCSICREAGHRRNKCPQRPGDDPQNGDDASEAALQENNGKNKKTAKLHVRRSKASSGVVIQEPCSNVIPSQASQIVGNQTATDKGKEKVAEESCHENDEENDEETDEENEESSPQLLPSRLRGPLYQFLSVRDGLNWKLRSPRS